jgi:4-hydroxybenzoate polyprenyltransferase
MSSTSPGPHGGLAAFWKNIRSHDWWEYKIPPLLATAYATALFLRLPFEQLWPLLLLILFALLPGAAYVSVLNDVTDIEDDRLAGKTNRMADKSPGFRALALTLCILPGCFAGWLLRNDPVTVGLYAATWIAYTLYSTPPIRLKVRGVWGVAMDASGAHILPTLWTSTLIAESTGHAIPWAFVASLGAWSLALGLRGILWHQLFDLENDRKSHVSTFATRYDARSIRRFAAWVLFPLEMLALACVLVQVNTPWAWIFLAIYLIGEWLTCHFLEIDLILVQTTARYRIAFAEYYQLWYPLTFLFAMAQQSWAAASLIVLQFLLFPHCAATFVRHIWFIGWKKIAPALRSRLRTILLPLRGNKL